MSDEWRVVGAGCEESRFLPIRLGTRAACRALVASLGMTIHGGFGGLAVGWGWLDMRSGRQRAGLKTGHYMLNEFGARGEHWSVWRWGRLWALSLSLGGLGLRLAGILRLWGAGLKAAATRGVGREEVVVVAIDGVADGAAPAFRAEGVDVFALGEVDGLHESLGQVSDGVGGFGLYIAADNGGDEAAQGGTEVASGEVGAGEEVAQVFAEFLRVAGAGFFLGVVRAEAGMVGKARSAATAAIGESKRTQGRAVLCTERGHRSLLRVEFWNLLAEENRYPTPIGRFIPLNPRDGAEVAFPGDTLAGEPGGQNRNASRGGEAQYATGILYHEGNAGQVKKSGASNVFKNVPFVPRLKCPLRG